MRRAGSFFVNGTRKTGDGPINRNVLNSFAVRLRLIYSKTKKTLLAGRMKTTKSTRRFRTRAVYKKQKKKYLPPRNNSKIVPRPETTDISIRRKFQHSDDCCFRLNLQPETNPRTFLAIKTLSAIPGGLCSEHGIHDKSSAAILTRLPSECFSLDPEIS